jgi:hypothetical protein
MAGGDRSSHSRNAPHVLLAILAKQKAAFLPLYLQCIEQLDYPKAAIHLYVRTNNNTDETETILREWLRRVGAHYASVEFDTQDVPERVEQYGAHEWNPERFRVMGRLRDASLKKTIDRGCQFYFVADVDNFIRSDTLKELAALNLPIVAPLLRMVSPSDPYSNFHAAVDGNGYYKEVPHYHVLLHRRIRGIIEVPVVHCTYLVRADVLSRLTYQDRTERYEYLVFSDTARDQGIAQYLDNRLVYGHILFDDNDSISIERKLLDVQRLIGMLNLG